MTGLELICLAMAVYHEARSEPPIGQLAVAQIVLNRVEHKAYPSTVCKVVKQGGTHRHRCQFSYWCDGKSEIPRDAVAWATALDIAEIASAGAQIIVLQDCIHYYSILFEAPYWTEDLIEVATIGNHRYFRKAKK